MKKLADRPNSKTELYSIPSYAEIALATLDEKPYLDAIIADVDGPDIFVQNVAIQKLAKVGGKRAFKTFVRLLDDTKYRQEVPTEEDLQRAKRIGATLRKGDEILEPRSFLVMKLLATMVANPPVSPGTNPNEKHIAVWKKWFKEHPEMIQ